MKPVAVTPRAAPATTNEARLSTAAGVATRVAELKAQSKFYEARDADEAARLWSQAMVLEGVPA